MHMKGTRGVRASCFSLYFHTSQLISRWTANKFCSYITESQTTNFVTDITMHFRRFTQMSVYGIRLQIALSLFHQPLQKVPETHYVQNCFSSSESSNFRSAMSTFGLPNRSASSSSANFCHHGCFNLRSVSLCCLLAAAITGPDLEENSSTSVAVASCSFGAATTEGIVLINLCYSLFVPCLCIQWMSTSFSVVV